MMELLVVTALGLIVLQWRATIKTTAPNRTRVTLAGKYRTTKKKHSSFNANRGTFPWVDYSSFGKELQYEEIVIFCDYFSQGTGNVYERSHQ